LKPEQFDFEKCTFSLQPAHVKPVDKEYCENVLCARSVPNWLRTDDIFEKFRVFVRDENKKIKKRGKTGIVELRYPIVNITKNKLCFVEFDPQTRDAQFALLMMKKVKFENKTRSQKEGTLIFSYAFKSNKK